MIWIVVAGVVGLLVQLAGAWALARLLHRLESRVIGSIAGARNDIADSRINAKDRHGELMGLVGGAVAAMPRKRARRASKAGDT